MLNENFLDYSFQKIYIACSYYVITDFNYRMIYRNVDILITLGIPVVFQTFRTFQQSFVFKFPQKLHG